MLVVSHSSRYSLQKLQLYMYIFKFVNVMPKVLSVPFYLDMDPKMTFLNDVTITLSLPSVMQILIGHFTIFQSHGLSG